MKQHPLTVVFLHLMLFQDGFSASQRLGQCKHEAVYLSASCFPYSSRWCVEDSPTLALIGCFEKEDYSALHPNIILDLYKESMQMLSKGEYMYSAAHGGIVKVKVKLE